MSNYLRAELRRVFCRVSRWVNLVIQCLIIVAIGYIIKLTSWSNENFASAISTYFSYGAVLFVGICELGTVYSDDFKSKTMQIAIGSGVSRTKVIAVKFIEIAIVSLFDLLIQGIVTVALGLILGAGLTSGQYGDLAVWVLIAWLTILCCTAAASIIMFHNQGGEIGKLIYIAMWAPVPFVLRYLLELGPLAQLQLSKYIYTEQLKLLSSYLMLGRMNFGCLISIVVFILACFGLAILWSRHKELDF